MTPEQRIERGIRYRMLMEDGELKEVFADTREDLIDAWRATFDAQQREQLWHTVRALDLLESRFVQIAADGRPKRADLEAFRGR